MHHPSADNIQNLYQRYAKAWQKMRHQSPFVEKSWLDRFISQIPLPEENPVNTTPTILDLGCGDGVPMAAYCIDAGFAIHGVDSAKAQIKAASKKFKAQTWEIADMRTFTAESQFDAILAWDSFFHLPQEDQKAMFAQFAKLAKPGAPLMFTSGPENDEAIGEFNGYELYHASLSPDEYRQLFIEHGFGLLQYTLQDEKCGGRTVWLVKKR